MANDKLFEFINTYSDMYEDGVKETLEDTIRSLERKGIINQRQRNDAMASLHIRSSHNKETREQEIPLYETSDGDKGSIPEEVLEMVTGPNRYSKYFEYAKRIYREDEFRCNLWDIGDKTMLNSLMRPKYTKILKKNGVIEAILSNNLQPKTDVIQRMFIRSTDSSMEFDMTFAFMDPMFLPYFRKLMIWIMEVMGMDYKYYYKTRIGLMDTTNGNIYDPLLQLIQMTEDIVRHFTIANTYLHFMNADFNLFRDLHDMMVTGYQFFKEATRSIVADMGAIIQPIYEQALYSGSLAVMSAVDTIWYGTYLAVGISSNPNISYVYKELLLKRVSKALEAATRFVNYKINHGLASAKMNIRERIYVKPMEEPWIFQTFNREMFEEFASNYVTDEYATYTRTLFKWGKYYIRSDSKRPKNPDYDGVTTVLE